MINRNIFIVFAMTLVFMLSMNSIAFGADSSFYRAPEEKIIDGQLYIDGIPYYDENEIANEDSNNKMNANFLADVSPMSASDWHYVDYTTYYTSQDYDRFENHSTTPVNRTLTTSSYTTYQVTGDTSAGFKSVAEAKIGASIGTKWGKKVTNSFTAKAKWKYELKSACRVFKYRYKRTTITGSVKYGYAHGNGGVTQWFYDNPIN